ncbi:MAG: Hsp33 family molecular chaperone HslO [Verrucomicrobiota bacterium]
MSESITEPDIEVRTYFARGRNALVARGDFSELFAAWYLHRMDHGIEVPPAMEDAGREALAALTLHCAGRPWKESCAWTVKFPEPLVNIFVACDNGTGTVIANLQTDGLQPIEGGMFYADVIEDLKPPRRSVVDFNETSFLRAVEVFYSRSEQRMVRFFWHGDEDLVMVAAQPDCDEEWLANLTAQSIRTLDRDVELALLEKRNYSFSCGCNQDRMLNLLLPVFQRQADELFHGEATLTMVCPRCGGRHVLTREALEARNKADK